MLFIYGSLALGGIETFFVRMAKARFLMGKKTKILLVAGRASSNPLLLQEATKYADVFFLQDFLRPNPWPARTRLHLLLMQRIDVHKIGRVFEGIGQVHVSSSIYGLFYIKLARVIGVTMPLTIGVYHRKEFVHDGYRSVPYHEELNLLLFREVLENGGVVFFNDKLPAEYESSLRCDMDDAHVFPLGVVFENDFETRTKQPGGRSMAPLRIVSVGRLAGFKTYNLYMLDVIRRLKGKLEVEYHVYGEGVLRSEMERCIASYSISDAVFLRGELPYDKFDETVREFDLFIGSGTSIIEASALGVPSIPAIESNQEPFVYGFVADVPGFTYHEDGLYEKKGVEELIEEFAAYDQGELERLRYKHRDWAKQFSMEECVANFERLAEVGSLPENLGGIELRHRRCAAYSVSFLSFALLNRLKGTSSSDVKYS